MKINYLAIGFIISLFFNSFMYFGYFEGHEKSIEHKNVLTNELKMKISESEDGYFSETKLIGKNNQNEIIYIVSRDYDLAKYAIRNPHKEIVAYYEKNEKEYKLITWMPIEENK